MMLFADSSITIAFIGICIGVVCAALVAGLEVRRKIQQVIPTVPRSRHQRSAEELEAFKASRAAAGQYNAVNNKGESEHDSATDEESYNEESEFSDSEDSEYERMEAMRLRMIFVIWVGVPKLPAHEVATLVATASISLMEYASKGAVGDGSPALSNATSLVPGSAVEVAEEIRVLWREWYLWWNHIGCGKITLKCNDITVFDSIPAAARAAGLPVCAIHRGAGRPAGSAPFPPGDDSYVVVAIGPAPASYLDPITGSLKLFA